MKIKRKTYFNIHSWTGITAGLVLFVICWSGTVAVFSNELDRLLHPSVQAGEARGPIAWERAFAVFKSNFPQAALQELSAPLKPGYALSGWAENAQGLPFRFYIDPVDYRLLEQTSYFNVQRFFRSLHMSFFEADFFSLFGVPIGYFVVGLFGFVLLLSALTGFLTYKKWKKGLFRLNTGAGTRIFWSDLHKLVGIWSLWFALLLGATGAWYLLEWWLPEPAYEETAAVEHLGTHSFLPISTLVKTAQEAYPELHIERLGFYEYEDGKLFLEGDDGAWLTRIRTAFVSLNAADGRVLQIQKAGGLSLYDRWWEAVDLLHFGKFWGLWSKWAYFIFGLGLSLLCLSGAYLQAQRQKLKIGTKHHRSATLVSYGLTVALLLMACWAGWAEIKGYGPNGTWPQVPLSVVLFLGLWTLTAFGAVTYWMYRVK
ncbi:PepSY-associated TM helix domain-containing protein [Maribacter sp. 2307ULW6-5]|uniref:PepSY-associated TM helix domain-containing protein n=1 Tax=Maribacter sp. 2307ULW6-5 TaxID=3386275 RepID=UPI0039BD89EF